MTADPTNSGTTAAAPIGREIDRRVDPIVAAVLACPQVAGLHGGRDGQAVTYLPGRRITGIRVTVDEVAIHVVAAYPAVMEQVADQVRRAVAPLAGGLRVDIAIEDLAVPGEPSSGGPPAWPSPAGRRFAATSTIANPTGARRRGPQPDITGITPERRSPMSSDP